MITPDAAHLARVLADVVKERARQDAKFGDQTDLPDVSPFATSEDHAALIHGIPNERDAKAAYEDATRGDEAAWLDVLVEEVAETLAPAVAGDLVHLREEVLQVAAVAVKWAQAIDKRIERRETTAPAFSVADVSPSMTHADDVSIEPAGI